MIGHWADKWLELETYTPRGVPVSGQDFRFLAMLGDSAYRINVFNGSLAGKWKEHRPEENTRTGMAWDRSSDFQVLADYLLF
ncbi:MAG: hypothetical protein KGY41_06665, partial [Desulfovermiculus sp.]|nr:hypothetical protein [Desulfovermiculus sp.]